MNKSMREYDEQILKLSKVYQRIGMGATLVTWPMFFLLYEPDMFRPLVWICVVAIQFLVISKILECRISIWYTEMPRVPRSKEVRWFVFFGAAVLLFQNKEVLKHPTYLLVACVVAIWVGAEIVYRCTEMP